MANGLTQVQKQLRLEQEGIQEGIANYRKNLQRARKYGQETEMPPGMALMQKSIEPMVKALKEFQKPSRGGARLHQTRKFLKEFDEYEVAYIVAKQLINSIMDVIPLQTVAVSLTKLLMDHYEYCRFRDANPKYLQAIERNLDKRTAHARHRKTVIMYAKRNKAGIEDRQWDDVDRLHIGVKLIEMFIESTGLVERVQLPHSQYVLQGTDRAKEWIQEQHARCEFLNPVYLPMIVKPKRWTSVYDGGFLTNKIKLVKTRNQEALEELENLDMPLVYEAVNTLQEVPWRINKGILNVLKKAWEVDSGIGNLPRNEEEPLPPTPWGVLTDADFRTYKEQHPEVVKGWKRRANEVYERRIRNKSKRFQVAQKLWIADKFKDEEAIYFVWTLDWRGRLYPVQPNINPQADDVGKALLEFAKGKPLGDDGVYWLAVQLANKYGVNKVSFDDRVAWVKEHEKDILLSATDPLGVGKRFWQAADAPWQCLAACFEWKGYKVHGKDFVSHLPIAMDGTCNGLQHFSAMLRDEIGGAAVNLVPSDKPQDVYQRVADTVEKKLAERAAKGDGMAKVWLGKVDRGMAKRPVMTMPYGVSKFGIKDQILEELKARNEGGRYLDCEDDFPAAIYLADLLYDCIGEVVVAARDAMDWLQEVASIVSSQDLPLIWTTPSGYRVYQHYYKQKSKDIRTYWGTARVRVKLSINVDTLELDKRKQAAGISPNFVHSMDASHLMLTIHKAKAQGISDLAMIHDSYGTHAANTGKLREILRDAFIEQYSQHDVLREFAEAITSQLPDDVARELPPLPDKGSLDLEEIRYSRYFFA